MPEPQPAAATNRTAQRILLVLSVVASAYIALFLIAAALRASYPLQLEWLEGGILDGVGRVMHHQGLYVQPTHFWVPFVYMPLYTYLGAAVCRVWGFGFEPLRWLSTACTVGCFVLQGAMAGRLAGSRAAGVIAAGYFAALYATTGFWYDLARVDMLFTFLVLLGIYLSWRGQPVWAAVAFALAFCAKQTGLVVGFFVLLHEYRKPKDLLRGLGTFAALLVLVNCGFGRIYEPWYAYYTRYLPAHQGLEWKGFYWFAFRDLAYPSFFALVLLGWAVWEHDAGGAGNPKTAYDRRWLVMCTAGLAVGCLASRVHSGGAVNVTIPLDAWFAVLFGSGIAFLLRKAETSGKRRLLAVGTLAGLQFLSSARSPARSVPSVSARQEAAEELTFIRRVPGEVYVFGNAVDVAVAGKQSFANTDAVFDVLRADRGPVGRELLQDMEQSFQKPDYAGLISSGSLSAMQPPTGAPQDYAKKYDLDSRQGLSSRPAEGSFASDLSHIFPRRFSPRARGGN